MTKNIKALSFDMYRTLLDTKDFHEQAVREILIREKAESIDPEIFHSRWDQVYDEVHLAMKPDHFMTEREVSIESLRIMFDEYGIKGDAEAGVGLWLVKYDKADLYQEVEEVLRILAKKYQMVIVSNVDNNDRGYAMVRSKNLPFLDTITSDSFKSYKPYNKLFKEALNVLKCKPEEVLHIGDSQRADVMGAKNFGMKAAWLNRSDHKLRDDIPAPDFEITDLRELLEIL